MNNEKIVLASGSPRRTKTLSTLGISFHQVIPTIDETPKQTENPEDLVSRLSKEKAKAAAEKDPKHRLYLGTDTIVSYEDWIIGKPGSREEAEQMLTRLSGKTHQVISGVTFFNREQSKYITRTSCTDVTIIPMTSPEILWYLDTEEWQGAAGGYRIQGKAALFISSIKGEYSNVVGLPINTFYGMLSEVNYQLR
ncbi:MAG: Maf family protein [Spirochaetia bacterium]